MTNNETRMTKEIPSPEPALQFVLALNHLSFFRHSDSGLKACFQTATGARIVSIRSASPAIHTQFHKERSSCHRGRCELGQLALRCSILKTRRSHFARL